VILAAVDVDEIAGGLRTNGFVTLENALPPALLVSLDAGCHDSDASPFAASGMGRGAGRNADAAVRGDTISWLDHAKEADHLYLNVMESLRCALNERLYLGLLDYECHYAIYGVGARYARHLDALAGRTNRLLSTVVYLDSAWVPADGGELVLYRGSDTLPAARILPQPGLMVLFLSEAFPHEVLTATRSRHSIAGWFSGRGFCARASE
jgi:SM-20-related protein